jgi:hypothetical protein
VVIAKDLEEAELTIQKIMKEKVLGRAGESIILEEFLQGEEVSFLVFADGTHTLPMVPSQIQDHPDNDLTNTAGPTQQTDFTPELHQHPQDHSDSTPREWWPKEDLIGILYFGLMTAHGPKSLSSMREWVTRRRASAVSIASDIVEVFEAILDRRLTRWTCGGHRLQRLRVLPSGG